MQISDVDRFDDARIENVDLKDTIRVGHHASNREYG